MITILVLLSYIAVGVVTAGVWDGIYPGLIKGDRNGPPGSFVGGLWPICIPIWIGYLLITKTKTIRNILTFPYFAPRELMSKIQAKRENRLPEDKVINE